ncbi:DUF4227 family protein [Paenibacillus abyssi]|uniref:DUF4227 domain-containing protein n=2 Tax=Paenibacillus abyssi TaxID=1340531 RepID=A0A917CG08_9BACL|nr:DUF4227 family protein [Paenibacillus abyssi]GGF87367.1 hypothetical protein GCM10010916_00880 [Paenibacillus abyssi]
MVVSLRKWLSALLFMLLFIGLTVLVFGGYHWLMDEVLFTNPYETPQGQALKVFQADPPSPDGASIPDRLRWFYWLGE